MKELNVDVITAYKKQRPEIMQEIPPPEVGGLLLVITSHDYREFFIASRAHFKKVQIPNGNFSARLPLERHFQKMTMNCRAMLISSKNGRYHVAKDYGGNFFDGKAITLEQAKATFHAHTWVRWKFPRKAKKEYTRFARIGRELGYHKQL